MLKRVGVTGKDEIEDNSPCFQISRWFMLHSQDILSQVLQILLKSKLLISDEEDEESDLMPSSVLKLFLQYKK